MRQRGGMKSASNAPSSLSSLSGVASRRPKISISKVALVILLCPLVFYVLVLCSINRLSLVNPVCSSLLFSLGQRNC